MGHIGRRGGGEGPYADGPLSPKAVGLALFLCLLWGGLAPAIKVALRGLPPITLAGLRFGLGLAIVALWAKSAGVRLSPTREEAPHLVAIGAIFFVQITLLNVGTDLTTASHSSVFLFTYPIFVAAFARLALGERLTPLKAAGLASAFGGVFALFTEGLNTGGGGPVGDGFVLASAFLIGVLTVYIKWATQWIEFRKVVTWEFAVGVPLFLFAGSIFERGRGWSLTLPVVASVLYQGAVIAGFAFVLWTWLLKRCSATRLTALSFTTPVFGVLLSRALLSDPLTPNLLLGAALVALGVWLVNRG